MEAFVGVWKGVCADGKDFVIVTLRETDAGELEGSVQMANVRGGPDGSCTSVVDAPSAAHAMKISDSKLKGSTLAFKAAAQADFEMTVVGSDDARLKFLGTPSEERPWKLRRVK